MSDMPEPRFIDFYTWLPSVLLNDNQIGYFIVAACVNDILDDMVTTVDTLRIGKDQSQFLIKSKLEVS